METLARALILNPGPHPLFLEIGINDGTIVVRDTEKGYIERLDSVEFQIAWPSISRSFGANGRLVSRLPLERRPMARFAFTSKKVSLFQKDGLLT